MRFALINRFDRIRGYVMNIFDILGPVMVGPSSSHTAGAVRIGRIARRLLGEAPVRARIGLCGSFAMTGHGHGTDRALLAGLLGMLPNDERIAASFDLARENGLDFSFYRAALSGEHPNTARLGLTGKSGAELSILASSLGGGRIMVVEMNGMRISFSGDLPTLIIQNRDQPGHVSTVATELAGQNVNIATLNLYRDHPGGNAVMIIETDKAVPSQSIAQLEKTEGIHRVIFVDAERTG